MAGVSKKIEPWRDRDRLAEENWSYPTGMVWCPMKTSGIAIMRCAELQREHGCGSLRQFKIVTTSKPEHAPFFWPWLRRRRECPKRANDKDVRELRLVLTPLKSVEKSRKNPRAYCCPACGGGKSFGARQCRRCWRSRVKR